MTHHSSSICMFGGWKKTHKTIPQRLKGGLLVIKPMIESVKNHPTKQIQAHCISVIHQPEFRRLHCPSTKQTEEMEVPLPQQLCVLFSILEFLEIRYPAGNYFISHLCTRKIIFPAMLGGDMLFFRRVQSLGMAPVINHIGSLRWGNFSIQGSYTCITITPTQSELILTKQDFF